MLQPFFDSVKSSDVDDCVSKFDNSVISETSLFEGKESIQLSPVFNADNDLVLSYLVLHESDNGNKFSSAVVCASKSLKDLEFDVESEIINITQEGNTITGTNFTTTVDKNGVVYYFCMIIYLFGTKLV